MKELMKRSVRERDPYLDVVKGIGIFFVVLGHSLAGSTRLGQMIYFFHMPLFFVVSGMLFQPERAASTKDLVRKIVLQLLVPYLFFVLLDNIVQFDRFFLGWINTPLHRLQSTFWHGTGGPGLWFLSCMGGVRLSAWLLYRMGIGRTRVVRSLVVVGLFVLGHLITLYVPAAIHERVPLMLMAVPAALAFYCIGWFCRSVILSCVNYMAAHRTKSCCLTLGAVALSYCLCSYTCICNCYFAFCFSMFSLRGLPPCMLELAAVFLAATFLARVSWVQNAFAYVGRNSLYYFAFESSAAALIVLMFKPFGVEHPFGIAGSVSSVAIRMVFVLLLSSIAVPILARSIGWLRQKVDMAVWGTNV